MTIRPTQPAPDSPDDRAELGNRAYSLYRTWVPIIWGALVTFLLTRVPALHDVFDFVYLYAVFEAAMTGLWYTVWRLVEHRIPNWLVTFLLGSSRSPVYVRPAAQVIRRAA